MWIFESITTIRCLWFWSRSWSRIGPWALQLSSCKAIKGFYHITYNLSHDDAWSSVFAHIRAVILDVPGMCSLIHLEYKIGRFPSAVFHYQSPLGTLDPAYLLSRARWVLFVCLIFSLWGHLSTWKMSLSRFSSIRQLWGPWHLYISFRNTMSIVCLLVFLFTTIKLEGGLQDLWEI